MTTILSKIATALTAVKDHVARNKFTYFLAFLSLALSNGHRLNAKRYDEFLTEKGIDSAEFWLGPEDYDEYKNQ